MAIEIGKVTKEKARLRLALSGPSGSGKTYSALSIARAMGGRICLFDTEYGSAAKYASEFEFDGGLIQNDYHPDKYIEAIHAAEAGGYDIIILDSLSHGWNGPGGVLELVTAATKRKSGNSYAAWDDVTPIYRRLIHTIMGSKCHIIVTLRAKQDYLQEKDSTGRTQIKKVGMAPEIREGFSYEMDIEGLLDIDHALIVGKTRCPALDGKVFTKPGAEFAAIVKSWLEDGAPAQERITAPVETRDSEPKQPVVVAKTPLPEWANILQDILNDADMKSADLAGALGVKPVTLKAIQKYIDGTGAHPRIALEGLVLSAKGVREAKADSDAFLAETDK